MRNLRIVSTGMLVAILLVASSAQAASFQSFLKIDGVTGSSANFNHKGEFDLITASFLNSKTGGKVNPDTLIVALKIEVATGKFLELVASGNHMKSAVLTLVDKNGHYTKYTLSDVVLEQYRLVGTAAAQQQSLALHFQKIAETNGDEAKAEKSMVAKKKVLELSNPVPVLASITPNSKNAGDDGFTLKLNGSHFIAGSRVLFNGAARATVFASPTALSATIPASDLLEATTSALFMVSNPEPGGGISSAVKFAVVAKEIEDEGEDDQQAEEQLDLQEGKQLDEQKSKKLEPILQQLRQLLQDQVEGDLLPQEDNNRVQANNQEEENTRNLVQQRQAVRSPHEGVQSDNSPAAASAAPTPAASPEDVPPPAQSVLRLRGVSLPTSEVDQSAVTPAGTLSPAVDLSPVVPIRSPIRLNQRLRILDQSGTFARQLMPVLLQLQNWLRQ